MSDSVATTDVSESISGEDHHDDHAHPTEIQYWVVFLVLAAITALEVLWSYLGMDGPALVVPLIVMMLVKFVIVAGVFMHLYFDFQMLNGKYFTLTFAAGIVIAMAVFAAVIASNNYHI